MTQEIKILDHFIAGTLEKLRREKFPYYEKNEIIHLL